MRRAVTSAWLAALLKLGSSSHQPEASNLACEHPAYRVHVVSSEPLVLYVRNFLSEEERRHLLGASDGRFRRSAVGGGTRGARRTSQSAYVAHDNTVQCIEERALAFQGYDIPASHLEPLQLVKYGPTEEYHFHTDWFADSTYSLSASGGNRVSSFFAFVHVQNTTTGGGTNFPLLNAPRDHRWCDIVDCDEPWDHGLTFRPVAGNAIYWENLRSDKKTGNYKTLHAGLPLTGGEKVGLNIWTRQAPLGEEVRGQLTYPGNDGQ